MIQKIKNHIFGKWQTVNVIHENGLIVHTYSPLVGKSENNAYIKVQLKIRNNIAFKIKCVVSTGFSVHAIDVDYVISLFNLHSYEELVYYKNEILKEKMPNLVIS